MVDSVDALPDSLAAPASARCRRMPHVARALYVPRDYRGRGWTSARQTPEQALIFTDAGVLLRSRRQGKDANSSERAAIFVRPDTLLYMRSSHLLLYGRLELVSAVAHQPVKLDMEFNAVGWRLMDTEWRSLVGKIVDLPPLPPDASLRESEHELELLEDAAVQVQLWPAQIRHLHGRNPAGRRFSAADLGPSTGPCSPSRLRPTRCSP